jgi:hypothetical protein
VAAADADTTGRPRLESREGRERLSHAHVSRLERLERYLRERAQRILCLREAGTPEVGIFYVIDGEFWLDSTPIPEAR